MQTEMLQRIETALRTRLASETETLVSNSIVTMEDYRLVAGRIAGIKLALDEMKRGEGDWLKERGKYDDETDD